MNIELKPIAESKVRQLGGDVCGVLVRKDGRLAAVDEHGRVRWLQDRRGISDSRAEFENRFPVPEGVFWDLEFARYSCDDGEFGPDADEYHGMWQVWQAARAQSGQGAEPVAVITDADKFVREGVSAAYKASMVPRRDGDIALYTHPQPAQQGSVPESIEVAIDMLEDYARALDSGDLDGAGHSTTSCIHEVIDELTDAYNTHRRALAMSDYTKSQGAQ